MRAHACGHQLESILIGVDQVEQRDAVAGVFDIKAKIIEAGGRERLGNAVFDNAERHMGAILSQRLAGGFLFLDRGSVLGKGENRLVPPEFLNKLAETGIFQPLGGAG